jgi:hypothetical protein
LLHRCSTGKNLLNLRPPQAFLLITIIITCFQTSFEKKISERERERKEKGQRKEGEEKHCSCD